LARILLLVDPGSGDWMRELGVGERLDQYELVELLARNGMATMLYEVLTCNLPFAAPDARALLRAKTSDEPAGSPAAQRAR